MYEEQISVDTEKFRNKVKELREDVTKELEDTSVDAAGKLYEFDYFLQ